MSEQNLTTITSARDIVFSQNHMQQLNNIAELMASSVCTVPRHLKGNKGDCFAITMQAAQWGMNPYSVAQKTFVVEGSGILGYEAQLVNAVITSMAPTKDRLHFEWFGNWEKVVGKFIEKTSQKGNKYMAPGWASSDEVGLGVKVWATLRGEDEPRELRLMLSQAQVRNSTLWASDPKQQLAYLGIKRWSRLYCPDVIMGVYSEDELEIIDPEKEINPIKSESKVATDGVSKLDEFLESIKTMSIEDFKKQDYSSYTQEELDVIKEAMKKRRTEIIAGRNASVVAETVATKVEEKNMDYWKQRIKECGDQETLSQLLKNEMPESVQIELSDAIDFHFDFLRG